MHPVAWLAGRATTVGAPMVAERIGRSRPLVATDIPRSGTDLTREWLTAVLCPDAPGAEVIAFTVPEAHAGTTSRASLRVTYNDVGMAAGLPTQLFTKSSASFAQRLMLGGADVLHGETHFFMTFRPRIEMEAPRGYFGGVDPRSWRSLILMEDIAATKGAQFIEPTTAISRSQLEDLLGNMAKYHGACWDDPDLDILKTPNDFYQNLSTFVRMGPRTAVGMERAKSVIPRRLYGHADKLWEGTGAWTSRPTWDPAHCSTATVTLGRCTSPVMAGWATRTGRARCRAAGSSTMRTWSAPRSSPRTAKPGTRSCSSSTWSG